MKILVVGAGYVGLPAALVLAEKGHQVTAYDTDILKVKNLQKGRAHINEPDLEILLLKQLKNQTLQFVEEIEPSDVFLIAVPTPIKKDFLPDLEFVETALRSILTVAERDNLIIIESTCPIGTTDYLRTIAKELRPDLCQIGLDGNNNILLDFAYCPVS